MIDGAHWYAVNDGDERALAIFRRHYSAGKSKRAPRLRGNAARIVGPGEQMVLITQQCDALFCWRVELYRDDDQEGINCTVFRNEGSLLSSMLIGEASDLAWRKWGKRRLFTFVNPVKIASRNPGYCFIRAGWRPCGWTPKGLRVLECL